MNIDFKCEQKLIYTNENLTLLQILYIWYFENFHMLRKVFIQEHSTSYLIVISYMLNCFNDYKRYIHILNHIFDLAWPK